MSQVTKEKDGNKRDNCARESGGGFGGDACKDESGTGKVLYIFAGTGGRDLQGGRAGREPPYRLRIPLAKMAVEETGMGIVEDKIIKNHYAAEYIYNTYKDTKTCGVVEEDNATGIMKVAEPIGVIGAVIPTTNPTSTAIFKTLLALKTRNGIIISPHPRAKNCTMAAAKAVLDAAVAAGAPADIISWIEA